MMLALYAKTCAIRSRVESKHLFIFKDANTRGELVYNFILSQLAKLAEEGPREEIYSTFIALFLTAPYIAWKAESEGRFWVNKSEFDNHVKEFQKINERHFPDICKPRLEQLGADCDRVHVIDEGERSLSLADERIEQAIIRMDAKLFILDPLQAYLGGADMHSANGVRPLMKALGAVAERTHCAIVIIGHLNKKGGKVQYRGLGSIDIFAAARSVLTVGRINIDENMRAVAHGKSNLAPPGPSLAFGLDPIGGFSWLGEHDITIDELLGNKKQQPEGQFSKARRLIETALANGPVPAVDMMQMAEEQGISAKTLHRAI